jgi:hypothetical protein
MRQQRDIDQSDEKGEEKDARQRAARRNSQPGLATAERTIVPIRGL